MEWKSEPCIPTNNKRFITTASSPGVETNISDKETTLNQRTKSCEELAAIPRNDAGVTSTSKVHRRYIITRENSDNKLEIPEIPRLKIQSEPNVNPNSSERQRDTEIESTSTLTPTPRKSKSAKEGLENIPDTTKVKPEISNIQSEENQRSSELAVDLVSLEIHSPVSQSRLEDQSRPGPSTERDICVPESVVQNENGVNRDTRSNLPEFCPNCVKKYLHREDLIFIGAVVALPCVIFMVYWFTKDN